MNTKWHKFLPIFIFVFSYIIISSNIGGASIYILDEAKNASCAREMLERNDLIVPTYNYELRTDKPPLHYFFMMLSYSIFGVNEFAARFFSAIFGSLTVLMMFFFARKFLNEKVALLSVLIILSSLHFVMQFHLAVPDPYLIFFINASLFSFYTFLYTKKKRYLFLFYISLGLGSLAKGPVALGLPGLILLVFLLLTRQLTGKNLKSFRMLKGALIYLFIALPWYIAVAIKTNGEWTEGFFLTHNVQRFTDTMEGHGGMFFFPLMYFMIGLLPFVVFMPQTFKFSMKNRKNPFFVFLLLIIVIFIVFFAFSQTQLPNYIVPVYPAFAILCAAFLAHLIKEKTSNPGTKISILIYTFFMIAIPIGIALGLNGEKSLMHLSSLAWGFIPLPIGASVALIFAFQKKIPAMIYSLSVSWILTSLIFFYVIFPKIDQENPVTKARETMNMEKPVAYYNRMNKAFAFYIRRPIPKLANEQELKSFVVNNPEGYIISSKNDYKNNMEMFNELELTIIMEQKDLFELPTTVVLQKE